MKEMVVSRLRSEDCREVAGGHSSAIIVGRSFSFVVNGEEVRAMLLKLCRLFEVEGISACDIDGVELVLAEIF